MPITLFLSCLIYVALADAVDVAVSIAVAVAMAMVNVDMKVTVAVAVAVAWQSLLAWTWPRRCSFFIVVLFHQTFLTCLPCLLFSPQQQH